jgi:hypothetical protein
VRRAELVRAGEAPVVTSIVARLRGTAYDRGMRFSSLALATLGLLVVACADDVGEVESTTTTTPPITTADDSTTAVADATATDATTGSTSAETDSVDDTTSGGSVCGDGTVEGAEVCDGAAVGDETCATQGFVAGELGCLPDCSGYDTRACLNETCGDGVAVGAETCDGLDTAGATCESEGFDSGTLVCRPDCSGFDASGCGTCGNNQVDGAEPCDGVWLQGQTCVTQGFTSGTIACASDCLGFDTAGCGLCGNGVVDGTELCDGADLGVADCTTFGFSGGTLACEAGCATADVWGCNLQQFDVSAPTTNTGASATRFRSNGYAAQTNGVLVDFDVYLGIAAPCDVDFYVYEAPAYGGPYSQVARTTVNLPAGLDYYRAGIPLVPVTAGRYYVLGVGALCPVTNYWNSTGAYAGADGGIGLFNVSHWDNAYPGPSDAYWPPNVGGVNTVYVQRVFFGAS